MDVVKRKVNKSSHDFFIVNLSISDVLFATVCLSRTFLIVLHPTSLLVCIAIRLLPTVDFCLSIFTTTSMAMLRCRTFCYPHKPKVPRKEVYVWICLIWLLLFTTDFDWHGNRRWYMHRTLSIRDSQRCLRHWFDAVKVHITASRYNVCVH